MRLKKISQKSTLVFISCFFLCVSTNIRLYAQGLNIPTGRWGIGFGNSKRFTGLRFNFRDSRVEKIIGINVTLWQPKEDNKESIVDGISLGLIPGAGELRGIQIGGLGIAAEGDVSGISIGLLGIGCGDDMTGVHIGGLGAGAGGSIQGLNIGGLGIGAGEDLRGINIGGLGAGAGGDMSGLNIGLLGVGAGSDLSGINIGGFGAGAGKNMAGLNIGLFGVGAGENLTGINIGGIGAGAGEELRGLTICGLGAGSPTIKGVTFAGAGVGGVDVRWIALAIGTVQIKNDGHLTGFAASGFNYIKGTQHGLSIGIVNYALRLKGIQLGLINIVRENPKGLRILPVMNANF